MLIVLGLMVLALAVWPRAGASAFTRSWVSTGPAHEWVAERFVMLGLPLVGFALIGFGALMAPSEHSVVRVGGAAILAVLVLPTLSFIMAFLPILSFLYPGWARRLRAESRAAWARRLG